MNTRENPIERPIAIFYIPKSDTTSVTFWGSEANLTPASGKTWKQIYLTVGTIAFSQNPGQSKAGMFFNVELTGSAPGESDEFTQNLESIIGRQNYFRIDFRSGRSKLFGDANRLPLCEVGISGQVVTQKNIRVFQQVKQPLPWLV